MSVLESKLAEANNALRRADTERLPSYDETPDVVVSDGFRTPTALPDAPELGAEEDVPPAYSEVHDRLSLHQAGFDAGASVTGK
jgi:hypothetical protein